jgi:predicted DNA-binding transcriptional regulator AlpA
MSDRGLRRVIPGRNGLTQYTGICATRQRQLERSDPHFPKPFRLTGKRGRSIGYYEDEIILWQQQRQRGGKS